MTIFTEREHAFEAKFAHDAELLFRAEARRNRLLGLWAAGLLGKSGEEATSYAADVVRAEFSETGSDDVIRKVVADLGGRADEAEVRRKIAELLPLAKSQVLTEV